MADTEFDTDSRNLGGSDDGVRAGDEYNSASPAIEGLLEGLLQSEDVGTDERAAVRWLEEACPDDPELRDAALRLWRRLREHDEERTQSLLGEQAPIPADLLETASTGGQLAAFGQREDQLPEIPGHTILRRIASGGMGSVYEAEQRYPRRRVAIKIIRPDRVSEQLLRRFEFETHMLARLQHPGIANVFEAGVLDQDTSHPQPYFVMEYIEGETLTEYAANRNLPLRERLTLMTKICDGVEHAHQKGVIHRDLKPANILVTEDGQPKILDFGVARATDADVQVTTIETDIGALIGTLPYMSPEQAGGDPNDVDTRSDVYALGVIAYELLTGQLPYPVRDKMIHEAVRIIREDDPTRLSSLNRTCRGDVETIVAKALEKEKDRRYDSASELAADIERYLNDEPIAARPPSTWYQVQKFAKRNRAAFISMCAVAAVLVIATGVSLAFAFAAQRAKTDANERTGELEIVTQFQENQLSDLDTQMMGINLRLDLLAKRRAAMERAGRTAEEIEQGIEELDHSLAGVNFTDVALESLDKNIFTRALKAIDDRFADKPRIRARLLQVVAETLRELGLYESALLAQEVALQIRRRELGNEHPDTLESLNHLGALHQALGQYESALSCFEEALSTRRRLFGEEHIDTLTSVSNMGSLLKDMGQYQNALTYSMKALKTRRRLLGNANKDTITSINNVGVLFKFMGQFDRAMPYHVETLEQCRQAFGNKHPYTIAAMNNLGDLLARNGRPDEALPYHEEALAICREIYGDENPHTAQVIHSLAYAHHLMESFELARQYYAEAIEIRTRIFGPEHPDTLQSINNMATLLGAIGDYADARAYSLKVIEATKRVYGDADRKSITAIGNMAVLLIRMHRYEEARPYLERDLELSKQVLGERNPDTLTSINNMGYFYRVQGQLQEAMPYYEEAYQGRRDILGARHPDTLSSMYSLGSLLVERGEYPKAEKILLECFELHKACFGQAHPNTIHVNERIVDLYNAWNAAEPDVGYNAKAEEWRQRLAESSTPSDPEPDDADGDPDTTDSG